MALSDQLRKLAERAQEAEKHVRPRGTWRRPSLRKTARDLAKTLGRMLSSFVRRRGSPGEDLRLVERRPEKLERAQRPVQKNIDTKIAEADLARAQRHADHAEADAQYAIDFAYSAIAEADYAVINAQVARKHADDLAAGTAARA